MRIITIKFIVAGMGNGDQGKISKKASNSILHVVCFKLGAGDKDGHMLVCILFV